MARDKFHDHPSLIVLGCSTDNKLPIFSFVIKQQPSGRLLHHNFVSAILNDLFGIQSRGGCACAGPYAQVITLFELVSLKLILFIATLGPFACRKLQLFLSYEFV